MKNDKKFINKTNLIAVITILDILIAVLCVDILNPDLKYRIMDFRRNNTMETTEDLAEIDWDGFFQKEIPEGVNVTVDIEDVEEISNSPYKGKTFSIIGDSYSQVNDGFWWGKAEYKWWSVTAKKLGMKLDTNKAVFGEGLYEFREKNDGKLPELGKPDVIYILVGVNDYAEGHEGELKENFYWLIDSIKEEHDGQIVLVTYPYKMTSKRHVKAQQYANRVIRMIAKEYKDVVLVDTDSKKSENLVDGAHMNPEGNFYMGEKIADVLLDEY